MNDKYLEFYQMICKIHTKYKSLVNDCYRKEVQKKFLKFFLTLKCIIKYLEIQCLAYFNQSLTLNLKFN